MAGRFRRDVFSVAVALDIATIAPVVQAVEELLEAAAETLFLLALLARIEAGGSDQRASMRRD